MKCTGTYANRPHIDSVCHWWCYLAPLLESGRFEAGQPFVPCIYKHNQTRSDAKNKKKEANKIHSSKCNHLPYCVKLEVSLCLPTAAKRNPTDHHWGGNLKLNMRGLLILLLQVHSRLTPKCKDELKNWGKEGEWLCVNPPPPPAADSFTLFTPSLSSCSLPPSIIPPP